jgi:hypothetical protein
LVSTGCVLLALSVPSLARAASSGVHLDPNSPEAKEYAIPIQAARGDDSGSSSGSSGQSADSGLFGAGISRASPPPPPPTGGVATKTAPTHAAAAKRVATRPATTHAPSAAIQADAGTAAPAADRVSSNASGGGSGGFSTAMFWVVAALVLLIPGLAVGIGVRRWRRV